MTFLKGGDFHSPFASIFKILNSLKFTGITLAALVIGCAAATVANLLMSGPDLVSAIGAVLTLGAAIGSSKIARSLAELADRNSHLEAKVENLRAELDEHQSAVDLLADGLNVAIFICDATNHVIYANMRAKELFRFDAPRGRSILAVTLSHDLDDLAKAALKIGSPQSSTAVLKEKEERILQAVAWPAQQNTRIFVSLYEVTELRKLERVRQDFVANVSHELRTPLTIIRAMAETLTEEPTLFPTKGMEYLTRITEEVDRLSLISNDLLILSVAESNPVRKQSCNIVAVWKHSVENLQEKASSRAIHLSFSGPDTLLIEANPTQMTQVAMNLVENALNYTLEGSVAVEVTSEGTAAKIKVRDTGIGISSEHQERIFERFYRVDKARSRVTGGTGLGLSIVRHIVESHGGQVSVESRLNQGSTFTISLPIGEPGSAHPAPAPTE